VDARLMVAGDHDCDARHLASLLDGLVLEPDALVGVDNDRFDLQCWTPSTPSVEVVAPAELGERLQQAAPGDRFAVVARGALAGGAPEPRCLWCGAVLEASAVAGPDLEDLTRALRRLRSVIREEPQRGVVVTAAQLLEDPAPLALAVARFAGLPGSGDRLALARLRVLCARLLPAPAIPAPPDALEPGRRRPVPNVLADLSRELAGQRTPPHSADALPPCPPALAAPGGQVGIVIPTHDDAELALDAVASVLCERDVACRLVVADDGSTEAGSRQALDALERLGYRVLRLPPSSVQATRNAGARALDTPTLVFLDADDLLRPGFLAAALRRQAACGATVVYGNAADFAGRRGRWHTGPADPVTLLVGNRVPVTALVDAEAFWAAGGFDETLPSGGLEDWDLWLRLLERGGTFFHLDQVAFDHRVRAGSATEHWQDPERRWAVVARIAEAHRALYDAHLGEMVALADRELQARLAALADAGATTGAPRPLT
jgi:hypothetical protein